MGGMQSTNGKVKLIQIRHDENRLLPFLIVIFFHLGGILLQQHLDGSSPIARKQKKRLSLLNPRCTTAVVKLHELRAFVVCDIFIGSEEGIDN